MSRDFAAITRSADSVATATTKSEVISLPPGYLVGFDVRLREDYTVVVTAGATNVGGSLVQTSVDHQLAEADWVAPKINSTRHYYIYLSKDGAFKVDIIAPTWNNDLLYYEHPDMNWRAIGKIFLVDSQIVYAVKQVELSGSTVTVAPEGFTGEADYYCTGEDDQILINCSIKYIHSAYSGGMVQLLGGTFSTSNSILLPYSNTTFSGSGIGTSIVSSGSYRTISVGSTSTVTDIRVVNFKINDTSNTSTDASIYISYVTNGMVDGINIVHGAKTFIFGDENSANLIISNNIIDGNSVLYNDAHYGIWIKSPDSIVSNNVVKFIRGNSGLIGILGYTGVQVVNNTIKDISTAHLTAKSYGIGVGGDRAIISDNKVEQVKNSLTANYAYGIYITQTSCQVTSNYCYNNGDDTGIANTNTNNFYDGGTDTQAHSNSWQDPVTGEKAWGEKKTKRVALIATATLSVSSSLQIGLATTSAPVGANAVSLELYYAAAAGASCPVAFGTTSTNILAYSYNTTGAFATDHLDCPLDSSGNFKIWLPGTAPSGAFNLNMTGYYS